MNLKKILEKHEMWLKGEEGRERADLRYTDLSGADLTDVDLRYANLRGTDLRYANLRYANLSAADLWNADLINANLEGADLSDADLRGVNLRGADLRGVNLRGIKTNIYTIGYSLACPEKGSFIAYKKANGCIIKLLILEDSKRSSATTVKCRCDKAKVLDIENIKTGLKVMEVRSNYDSKFIYRTGEIVSVDNFDDDRWNECSTVIHFFMNIENAMNY